MLTATIYIDLNDDYALSELQPIHDETFVMYKFEVIDGETIKFLIDAGEHRESIAAVLDGNDAVYSVEPIAESQLLITKRSSGVIPIIRENHGMFQRMNEFNGTGRMFEIVVFNREDLKNIIDGLRELGSVRLERLKPFAGYSSSFSTRQGEVLELAYEHGYFDWPRETDVKTLADQLDISHTTFLEHLRKAEKKVIGETLNGGTTAPTILEDIGNAQSDR
ncbi:helix-turn-helix domain-containing protein [Natrialba taiwanensis]|uniref:Bacterio-opsin activator-like protein n=1 Tax=Natrialba taiwanensis DSM 12281 TaxID=1230458 RepID=L9ZKS5_9EURY|nr:helix-turn-helix domain-containing protein [Natrialba taiwanensis]ELY86157.1 bacterio-opsin activator-like protein [Natrialba taiwanensis DSM 12281]